MGGDYDERAGIAVWIGYAVIGTALFGGLGACLVALKRWADTYPKPGPDLRRGGTWLGLLAALGLLLPAIGGAVWLSRWVRHETDIEVQRQLGVVAGVLIVAIAIAFAWLTATVIRRRSAAAER